MFKPLATIRKDYSVTLTMINGKILHFIMYGTPLSITEALFDHRIVESLEII